ncbi:phosphatase PAP2 family protein [Dactylosporangium sp. CA-139066]|uniref:phosphatase PAP2 family protein n=1 Tax=Dactylosporangium sp. CA-139066 TaxID=3239930 RepID=UPI003D8A33F4
MRLELRPIRPAGWWLDAVLVAGFVAVTLLLAARTPLLHVDTAVRDFVDAHRPHWFYITLRVGNLLGQGGMVLTPLVAIAAFFMSRARHTVRPFLPFLGAELITYVTIGPLKVWTDRTAPSDHKISNPEWLFRIDTGMSYPSGHVVNTIVFYGVLATMLTGVLRPRLVTALRYTIPLVVVFTTTYLSFHWFTDGIAALMVGLVLERLLRRVPWDDIPLGGRLTRAGWAGPFYDVVEETQEPARITR